MQKRVDVYLDQAEEWRWKFYVEIFGRQENLANSGEGYKNDYNCIDAMWTVITKRTDVIVTQKFKDGTEKVLTYTPVGLR